MINWTEIIIALCSLLITGVLVPLIAAFIKNKKAELSAETQATIEYWVQIGVLWAKQWLDGETGARKKYEVLKYVSGKLQELKIDVSEEDLDKIIEAVYAQVKSEVSPAEIKLGGSE